MDKINTTLYLLIQDQTQRRLASPPHHIAATFHIHSLYTHSTFGYSPKHKQTVPVDCYNIYIEIYIIQCALFVILIGNFLFGRTA